MIEYYEQLMQEEQEALTDVIQLLYRQTFLLERKYDRRAGRLAYVKEYRICRQRSSVAGENRQHRKQPLRI